MGEFVPGYEASAVFGVGAPKATPTQMVDSSTRSQRRAQRRQSAGATCRPRRHGASRLAGRLAELIARTTEKWAKVIQAAHIEVD